MTADSCVLIINGEKSDIVARVHKLKFISGLNLEQAQLLGEGQHIHGEAIGQSTPIIPDLSAIT